MAHMALAEFVLMAGRGAIKRLGQVKQLSKRAQACCRQPCAMTWAEEKLPALDMNMHVPNNHNNNITTEVHFRKKKHRHGSGCSRLLN